MFGPSATAAVQADILSLPEREEIALLRAQGCTIRGDGRVGLNEQRPRSLESCVETQPLGAAE